MIFVWSYTSFRIKKLFNVTLAWSTLVLGLFSSLVYILILNEAANKCKANRFFLAID